MTTLKQIIWEIKKKKKKKKNGIKISVSKAVSWVIDKNVQIF